jgi:DNA-binding CsgD family transcriptional regulator
MRFDDLGRSQARYVQYVLSGVFNPAVLAAVLNVSVRRVDEVRRAVLSMLGLDSLAELVALAYRARRPEPSLRGDQLPPSWVPFIRARLDPGADPGPGRVPGLTHRQRGLLELAATQASTFLDSVGEGFGVDHSAAITEWQSVLAALAVDAPQAAALHHRAHASPGSPEAGADDHGSELRTAASLTAPEYAVWRQLAVGSTRDVDIAVALDMAPNLVAIRLATLCQHVGVHDRLSLINAYYRACAALAHSPRRGGHTEKTSPRGTEAQCGDQ